MKISEIYLSVQGEGRLTGTESVFVRTSGCHLRCWYCDTPYASWHPEGYDLSVEEIIQRITEWDCPHVVITGGEPMLYSELLPLTQRLRRSQKHITVETAGTLYLPVECDLMSISPKLASSAPDARRYPRWARRHARDRWAPRIVRRLIARHGYQLKFVIDTREDLVGVAQYLEIAPEIARSDVYLMPQGTSLACLEERRGWLEPYCREHGLNYCPRRQFEWFGNLRGT